MLRRSAADNKPGGLYDYAAVSWGLLHWANANNDNKAKQVGINIAQAAWKKFYQDGYWMEDSTNLLPSAKQLAHIADSAIISPEALLIEASYMTNQPSLVKQASTVKQMVTRALEIDLFS